MRPAALNPAVWCDGAKADWHPLDLHRGSGSDLSKRTVVACSSGGRRRGLWSDGEEAHISGGFKFSCEWKHGQQLGRWGLLFA